MCCCIAVSIVISTVKQQNCNIGVLLYLWTNVKTTLLLAYLFHLRFCTAVCMLHFCSAMLCKRGLYAVTRCPSVCLSDCLSVRPSRLWILPKRVTMSSIFSPSGSQTILVFPYQTAWQYSDGNPPNGGGASNPGGVGRNRDSGPISGSITCCERLERQVHYTQQRRTMVSWWQLLASGEICWWRETTTKCMTRSLNVTLKTTDSI